LQPDEFDYMVILSKFKESDTNEGEVNYTPGNKLQEAECFLGTDGKISSAHVLYYL
jgi:hypothetical protein